MRRKGGGVEAGGFMTAKHSAPNITPNQPPDSHFAKAGRLAGHRPHGSSANLRCLATMLMPDDFLLPRSETVDSVVYASRACFEGTPLAQVRHIGASAAARNAAMGVASTLLYQSGWFVHWLEGPGTALDQVLTRIARDARHRHMRLLHREPAERRLLVPWSSAVMESPETPDSLGRRIDQFRHARRQRLALAPAQLLRLLSTPLAGTGGNPFLPPQPLQRLMVCARQSDRATSLVHWLARKHRRKVGHGRFTGGEAPSLSIRYVDFGQQGQPRRVVALPPSGLKLGIVQALLADYGYLLLLFEGDAGHDRLLMHDALRCLARLGPPQRPSLIGLGLPPSLEGELSALALQAGQSLGILGDRPTDAADINWSGLWPALQELLKPVRPPRDENEKPSPPPALDRGSQAVFGRVA